MPDLIKVGMADYKVGAAPSTLISYGLGSCIGLSLYDPQTKVGGLLHYMLPDSKQARPSDTPAKFIDTGFPLMLADVLKLGQIAPRGQDCGRCADVCVFQYDKRHACR